MTPDEGSGLTDVLDFVERFRREVADGTIPPIEHYLALYPDHPEHIRQTYEELVKKRQAETRATTGSFARSVAGAVGPYKLVRRIGAGGQGLVYLANDSRLDRLVALKVLHPTFVSSAAARERFRREAQLISRLEQPGLCGVYEADLESDTPYIAMPFVEGDTLRAQITRARDTLEDLKAGLGEPPSGSDSSSVCRPTSRSLIHEALRSFEQLARSLHVAHEARVVHRDIKPGNIMVTPEGELVLLDFGLARNMDESALPLTGPGEVFGTPGYMSPEQLQPKALVDRRTDVYSLAVTLYETLTLQRAFQGAGMDEQRRAILEESASDPRQFNEAIPIELKIVLETAMEKDLTRRYATALDFAEELRRIWQNEPIVARPPSLGYQLAKFVERNRRAVAVLSVLFFALSAGLVLAGVGFLRARAAEQRVKDLNASTAIDLAHAAADKGLWEDARRYLEQARQRRDTWEGRFVELSLAAPPRALARLGFLVGRLETASRAPRALAVGGRSAALVDLESGEVTGIDSARFHEGESSFREGALSVDGTRFALSIQEWLLLGDARTGVIDVPIEEKLWSGDLVFTPAWLAAASNTERLVRLVDPRSGALLETIRTPDLPNQLAFADSTSQLIGCSPFDTWSVEYATAQPVPASGSASAPFSARRVSSRPTSVEGVHDYRGTRYGAFLLGQTNAYRLVEPDGHLVSTGDYVSYLPELSPDGQLLAAARDGVIHVRNAKTGRFLGALPGMGAAQARIAFDHRSRVVVAGDDGTVHLWDLSTGLTPRTFRWWTGQKLGSRVEHTALGSTTAVTARRGQYVVWDLLEARERYVARCVCAVAHGAVTLGPNGEIALSGDVDRYSGPGGQPSRLVLVLEPDGRGERCRIPTGADRAYRVAFHPDGSRIALGFQERDVEVYSGTGELLHRLEDTQETHALAWLPDGALAVGFSPPKSAGRLAVFGPDAKRRWFVSDAHENALRALAASPDGRWLASSGRAPSLGVWDARTGKLVGKVETSSGTALDLDFHPNEPRLAGVAAGAIRLWDLSRLDARAPPELREVLVHDSRLERLDAVRFIQGGATLAAAGTWGLILLETSPADAQLAREREARRRVRNRALELLARYPARPELAERLYAHERAAVLAVVDFHESPEDLNLRAWDLASRDTPAERCRLGLRWMARAHELAPGRARYWNTTGALELRAGLPADAVKSLTISDEINHDDDPSTEPSRPGSSPFDLLYRARAYAQLGELEKAEADLAAGEQRIYETLLDRSRASELRELLEAAKGELERAREAAE